MDLSELPAGTTINGRYELTARLGTGSGGSVYGAHDRHLDTHVAVKLLNPSEAGTAGNWQEAQLLERLKSRFLLPVVNADVVTDSDIRFIVTPVLGGGDLAGFAGPNGVPASIAAHLVQQIASGLDRIHRARMAHRDVKPGNVLIEHDDAVLGDLGFCHLLDENETTPPDGTFCTVAPEVIRDGGRCTTTSDVYSLAATAFYVLSGEYPINHRVSKEEQYGQIINGSTRELRSIAPHISRAVGAVVRKSLNNDPSRRHASATDFGNAFAGAVQGSRDWQRVSHAEHLHCFRGASYGAKKEVLVCSVQIDKNAIQVRARMARTGRQVPSKPDTCVVPSKLTLTLQQLTASL